MSILRLFFELFVIYILYKLVFEFIIPVYRASKQVHQKMNEMHERMQQTQSTTIKDPYANDRPGPSPKPASEDYIEYEEVK